MRLMTPMSPTSGRRGSRGGLAALIGALALTACGCVLAGQAQQGRAHPGTGQPPRAPRASADGGSTRAEVRVTTPDGSRRLSRARGAAFDGGPRKLDIAVNAARRAQRFTGAGASVTEASARLLKGLPGGTRQRLLTALFSAEGGGSGLDYLRQPLGSSDFAAGVPHTYEDKRGAFSLARDEKEIIPLLRQARRVNSRIRFMGSPWSAPAWMKDSGRLGGGGLRPERYDDYAGYLVKALKGYASRGIPIGDLTVQNEPLHTASYPSMRMTADEQTAFLRVLDRELTRAGLGTRLFAYDHNWDSPAYPLHVLRGTRDIGRVRGAAFHCYAGRPEAQRPVRDAGFRVFLSECSGTDSDDRAGTFADTLKWQTENLVIRGLRAGSETVMLWNLALDPAGGPHVGDCADRCNGVVEVDGERTVKNAEFYVLGHLSKFVDRGARRVRSTTQGPGGVQNVVYRNPDGSRAAVVLNATDSARSFSVTESGRSLAYRLPAGAVATFTWPGAPAG